MLVQWRVIVFVAFVVLIRRQNSFRNLSENPLEEVFLRDISTKDPIMVLCAASL